VGAYQKYQEKNKEMLHLTTWNEQLGSDSSDKLSIYPNDRKTDTTDEKTQLKGFTKTKGQLNSTWMYRESNALPAIKSY
jgi:hypothetical protein